MVILSSLPSMKSHRIISLTLLIFLAFLAMPSLTFAQHFVKMTDQQWIELALDMIRKGVQQQDTTKVLMVIAPEVSVKGERVESKATISRKLQTIFNSSYKRKNQLEKPDFPRSDNPLHYSNFWDFDILEPNITINGDSAVVECELVLWGAKPDNDIGRTGRRAKERFVFISPPKIEQGPPSADWHKWPASSSGKNQASSIRCWKLVSFETLFNFLDNEMDSLSSKGINKEGR